MVHSFSFFFWIIRLLPSFLLEEHLHTFRSAVDRLPLVIPLGLSINVVVFTVGRMGRRVRGTVLVHRQLTVRVRVI